MKKILVTGGAGFIGSNYVNYQINKGDNHIINLDKLTYAGNLDNIENPNADNYTFVEGDICDLKLVQSLFNKYKFDEVIHFAAESHVDNSILDPSAFIDNKKTGTYNLIH